MRERVRGSGHDPARSETIGRYGTRTKCMHSGGKHCAAPIVALQCLPPVMLSFGSRKAGRNKGGAE